MIKFGGASVSDASRMHELVEIVRTEPHQPLALLSLGRAGAHVLALGRGADSPRVSLLLPDAEVEAVVRALHADLHLA